MQTLTVSMLICLAVGILTRCTISAAIEQREDKAENSTLLRRPARFIGFPTLVSPDILATGISFALLKNRPTQPKPEDIILSTKLAQLKEDIEQRKAEHAELEAKLNAVASYVLRPSSRPKRQSPVTQR